MPTKARNALFILLGVAGLLLKGRYSGPYQDAIGSYGGNFSASFAVYFWATILPFDGRYGRLLAAGIALPVVELFEVTNGFGVMTNVYDPTALAANAVGTVLAVAVDSVASGISSRRSNRDGKTTVG